MKMECKVTVVSRQAVIESEFYVEFLCVKIAVLRDPITWTHCNVL